MKSTPIFTERRGMLLLMVILLLSLFMAAGAMLLTIAARARAAARANAQSNQQTGVSESVARDALDAALLAAIRGAASGTNGSVTVTGTLPTVFENLLEDKYGLSLTGSGSGLSGPTPPVLTGTNTPVISFALTAPTLSSTTARALGGRVATIVPAAGDGDISSHRILGVLPSTTGVLNCFLAQLPGATTRTLPRQPFTVIINGREFTPVSGTTTPESYDAYDDQNRWLAQPALVNGQLSGTNGSFARLSFIGTGGTPTVDNDNDGVLDGTWIPPAITSGSATPPPFVIPDQPSPLGGTLRFQVSYLILDLDGRINVNAAGMATSQGDYAFTENTPIGMGYGPADINCSLLFPHTLPNTSGTYPISSIWTDLLQSGTPTTTPMSPTEAQRRTPPVIGRIDGRSGTNAVPGALGDDATGNQQTSTVGTDSIYTLTLAGGNAVADLKAQTRAYMSSTTAGASQLTPTLTFYRPSWSGTAGADGIEDPYETRLDADAPRPVIPRRTGTTAAVSDDSIFALAELESVLRPGDPDAAQLPQRLAAGLEDLAQRSRMTITTDSWSTPGLTGLASRQIENFLTGTSFPAINTTTWTSGSSVVSPDVAAGLRFNINRPVLSGTLPVASAQQQQYCRDLYTLVMALATGSNAAPPTADVAAQYAQWAANVLDFRDADSVMTRFAYDPTLQDGWQVNASSPVVYGAERPEVVITETAAWRDSTTGSAQLFVTLHRPSRLALLTTGSGGATTSGTSESLDPTLSGTTGNLNLAQTHDDTPTGWPVWQLRFDLSSPQVVQFRSDPASPFQQAQFWSGTSGTTTVITPAVTPNPIPSSGNVCVASTPSTHFSITDPAISTIAITSTAFRLSTSATKTIRLERLANPSAPNSSNNPYIPVDSSPQNTENIFAGPTAPNTSTWVTTRRGQPSTSPATVMQSLTPFWLQQFSTTTKSTLTAHSVSSPKATVAWLHWPNRPFISQAELALVPTGSSSTTSTDGVLANYSFPTNSLATSTTSIVFSSTTAPLGSLIVDATYVPSRFAENAVTITGSSINVVGLDKLQANHFSKWREPGRVNVNTIISGTNVVSGTTASLDDVVWTTFMGNTYVANPFIPTPARSSTIPAVPAVPASPTMPAIPATPAIPPGPAIPARPAHSISHVLSLSGPAGQPIATQDFTTSGATLFPRDKNPYFNYSQAIRLANTATVQSNVFAIWITVRITDDSPNAQPPVNRRLFAIVDRSIPVGYSPNRDLNVRDTIRLKRHLD